jgi:hypothetical protein
MIGQPVCCLLSPPNGYLTSSSGARLTSMEAPPLYTLKCLFVQVP